MPRRRGRSAKDSTDDNQTVESTDPDVESSKSTTTRASHRHTRSKEKGEEQTIQIHTLRRGSTRSQRRSPVNSDAGSIKSKEKTKDEVKDDSEDEQKEETSKTKRGRRKDSKQSKDVAEDASIASRSIVDALPRASRRRRTKGDEEPDHADEPRPTRSAEDGTQKGTEEELSQSALAQRPSRTKASKKTSPESADTLEEVGESNEPKSPSSSSWVHSSAMNETDAVKLVSDVLNSYSKRNSSNNLSIQGTASPSAPIKEETKLEKTKSGKATAAKVELEPTVVPDGELKATSPNTPRPTKEETKSSEPSEPEKSDDAATDQASGYHMSPLEFLARSAVAAMDMIPAFAPQLDEDDSRKVKDHKDEMAKVVESHETVHVAKNAVPAGQPSGETQALEPESTHKQPSKKGRSEGRTNQAVDLDSSKSPRSCEATSSTSTEPCAAENELTSISPTPKPSDDDEVDARDKGADQTNAVLNHLDEQESQNGVDSDGTLTRDEGKPMEIEASDETPLPQINVGHERDEAQSQTMMCPDLCSASNDVNALDTEAPEEDNIGKHIPAGTQSIKRQTECEADMGQADLKELSKKPVTTQPSKVLNLSTEGENEDGIKQDKSSGLLEALDEGDDTCSTLALGRTPKSSAETREMKPQSVSGDEIDNMKPVDALSIAKTDELAGDSKDVKPDGPDVEDFAGPVGTPLTMVLSGANDDTFTAVDARRLPEIEIKSEKKDANDADKTCAPSNDSIQADTDAVKKVIPFGERSDPNDSENFIAIKSTDGLQAPDPSSQLSDHQRDFVPALLKGLTIFPQLIADSKAVKELGTKTLRLLNLDRLKLRIYAVGRLSHKRWYYERLFGEYWSMMSKRIESGNLSDGHKCKAVLDRFLNTRRLRRLHNKLILGLLDRCRRTHSNVRSIGEHIPLAWKDRVIDSSLNSGSIKSAEESELDLWPGARVAEVELDRDHQLFQFDAPLIVDLDVGTVDEISRPTSGSSCIPGAMAIDPLIRGLCAQNSMKVSENAVWLLVIAMRQFTSSCLKRIIAEEGAAEDMRRRMSRLQSQKTGSNLGKRMRVHDVQTIQHSPSKSLRTTLPVRCLHVFDFHSQLARSSLGDSVTFDLPRDVFETGLHASSNGDMGQATASFDSVRQFMTYKLSIFTPAIEKQQATSNATISESMVSESKATAASGGLGRGAKDLASLKARSTKVESARASPVAGLASTCTGSSNAQELSVLDDKAPAVEEESADSMQHASRRGKGFGVKNLAAMRARSVTSVIEDNATKAAAAQVTADDEKSGGAQNSEATTDGLKAGAARTGDEGSREEAENALTAAAGQLDGDKHGDVEIMDGMKQAGSVAIHEKNEADLEVTGYGETSTDANKSNTIQQDETMHDASSCDETFTKQKGADTRPGQATTESEKKEGFAIPETRRSDIAILSLGARISAEAIDENRPADAKVGDQVAPVPEDDETAVTKVDANIDTQVNDVPTQEVLEDEAKEQSKA